MLCPTVGKKSWESGGIAGTKQKKKKKNKDRQHIKIARSTSSSFGGTHAVLLCARQASCLGNGRLGDHITSSAIMLWRRVHGIRPSPDCLPPLRPSSSSSVISAVFTIRLFFSFLRGKENRTSHWHRLITFEMWLNKNANHHIGGLYKGEQKMKPTSFFSILKII